MVAGCADSNPAGAICFTRPAVGSAHASHTTTNSATCKRQVFVSGTAAATGEKQCLDLPNGVQHPSPPACCRTHTAPLLSLLPLLRACLPQALQKTTPMMRAQQAIKYTGQRTNFFSLLRFDFMLDENLDTYLIEVGGSVWRALGCACGWPW